MRVRALEGVGVADAMERVDWSATPLGPPESWSQSLRSAVRVVLGSRFSMWMGWGPDLTFFYNDAYARDTLNTKHPWALGRPAREVWAEIWEDISPRIDRVLSSGEATWDEALLLYLERSGYREETYHTFSYSPLEDDAGATVGMLCVVVEETERVLGERRLATLNELATALNTAQAEADVHAAFAAAAASNPRDLPFAFTYLYTARRELRTAAVVGERPVPQADEFVPGTISLVDGGEALVIALADAADPAPVGYLVVGINPERVLDDAYRGFLELVAGQVAAGFVNVRAREAERRRAEALAELDRAKTAFFQNVSHEFRTPLSLILGPAQDALESAADEPDRERLSVVLRNALRLQKLVNNLLDFSRLESGQADPAREPTDLAAFTADLASMFRSATERAGIALVVERPPDPVVAAVDRQMWERIVLNLVSNAFKFTFEGSIRVALERDGGEAVLSVSDTGTGIPPAEVEGLFERFRRVRGAKSRTHEGSGIGLALVQELVRLHGGSVAVETQLGAGSEFTVRIPLADAAAVAGAAPTSGAAAYVEEALRWLPEAGEAVEALDVVGAGVGERPEAERAHVLVADDNADLRDYLARLLGQVWSVEAVGDGRAALEAVRRRRPDLVVSDAMMPELDGFGLLAALRADPATAQIPVLMLSARAGEEAAVEGLAAGADDYLVKPFSSRELLARVRAALDLAELRQAAAAATERHAQLLRDLADAAITINRARGVGEVLQETARAARDLVGAPWVRVALERGEVADEGTVPLGRSAVRRVPIAGGELVLPHDGGAGGVEAEAVLTQLAQVASTRLDNAVLYEREHQVAETLQRSLLPPSLPELANGELAAVYLPGSSEASVGGDWYDAFALDAERVVVVIGDVVGRGVRAASTMGQLRNAMRAYVLEGYGPAEALERVNRLVHTFGGGFATVLCAVVDLERGTIRYARAGHPPLLVACADGSTRWLDGAVSPPIGAAAAIRYREADGELPPGAALVLYTDGLVERRSEVLDIGLGRLAAAAAESPGDARTLAEHLAASMPPSERPDDVAVLVLARSAEPSAPLVVRLPAVPRALAPLRRHLRAWLAGAGVTETAAQDLLLAAGEAAANAVEHPVAADPAVVVLTAERDGDAVRLAVSDHGAWNDTPSAQHRGNGLKIIAAVATQVESDRTPTGTTMRILRTLP